MLASRGLLDMEPASRQQKRLEIDFVWKELFQSDWIKQTGVL